MIYLDTHVVLWLAAGDAEQLSDRAAKAIRADELRISPMVNLELHYLEEAGRLVMKPQDILVLMRKEFGLTICTAPFGGVVDVALNIRWTRDPFDRIISAQAMFAEAPLVTKDTIIRKHCSKAVW